MVSLFLFVSCLSAVVCCLSLLLSCLIWFFSLSFLPFLPCLVSLFSVVFSLFFSFLFSSRVCLSVVCPFSLFFFFVYMSVVCYFSLLFSAISSFLSSPLLFNSLICLPICCFSFPLSFLYIHCVFISMKLAIQYWLPSLFIVLQKYNILEDFPFLCTIALFCEEEYRHLCEDKNIIFALQCRINLSFISECTARSCRQRFQS